MHPIPKGSHCRSHAVSSALLYVSVHNAATQIDTVKAPRWGAYPAPAELPRSAAKARQSRRANVAEERTTVHLSVAGLRQLQWLVRRPGLAEDLTSDLRDYLQPTPTACRRTPS